MSDLAVWAFCLLAVLFATLLLPVVGMAALMPTLRHGRLKVRNYRGAEVTPGLGVVWVWWVAGFVVLAMLMGLGVGFLGVDPGPWDRVVTDILGTFALAAIAIIPAFVFGMIDDVFDSGTEKGFRGHLGALRSKRLSTGLLKLVGIGVAALLVAAGLTQGQDGAYALVGLVVRTLVIALSANVLNLFDLRPGRALKAYGLGTLVIVVTVPFVWAYGGAAEGVAAALVIGIALAGPLLAVWRFDISEVGMLGDAGSNPAGVLLGVVASALWPLPVLVAVAVLLVGLNAMAERISLQSLIESNAILKRIDDIGRRGDPSQPGEMSADS